jgi:hypothetical protein
MSTPNTDPLSAIYCALRFPVGSLPQADDSEAQKKRLAYFGLGNSRSDREPFQKFNPQKRKPANRHAAYANDNNRL